MQHTKILAAVIVSALTFAVANTALAAAPVYQFRVGAKGVLSPLKDVTMAAWAVPSKAVGDAAFALTAPASPSDGLFTYASNNPAVATVSGNIVTIVASGTATITATQAKTASYNPGTVAGVLYVSPAGFVSSAGLTWAKPDSTNRDYYSSASFCTAKSVNGVSGWRLPIQSELAALYADKGNAALVASGWPMANGYQSNQGVYWGSQILPNNPTTRMGYSLAGLGNFGLPEGNSYYAVCVHP